MPAHLLDTNILLRSSDANSPSFQKTRDCVSKLLSNGDELWITAQNIVEYWAVATRPISANGLGWDTIRTESEVVALLNQFPLLPETADIFSRWREIVLEKRIQGKRTHDARLVAVMLANQISSDVTLNPEEGDGFPEITITNPNEFIVT